MSRSIVTNDRWVLKSAMFRMDYTKEPIPEMGSRDKQYETILLWSMRTYDLIVYMYKSEEHPSKDTVVNDTFIILTSGRGLRVKLPSLDNSSEGLYRKTNPDGGEWKIKGWTNVYDETTERWITTVSITGSWNNWIVLNQYNVQNWI